MDLYQTLDLPKKATAAEVKKAYRRKAKQHHPDKGGKATDMADINHAYAVLSDETRRASYDNTGSDKQAASPNAAAHALLMQLFVQALNAQQPDVVRFTRDSLYGSRQEIQANKVQTTARLNHLLSRRGDVSVSEGDNLFHSLIDQQVSQGRIAVANLTAQEAQVEAALELLKAYTSNVTAQPVQPRYAQFTNTTAFFR